MLDFLSFRCCQDVTRDDLEFDLEIKNTITNPRNLDVELKNFKTRLKSKLCLFTIYSATTELLPFNELKNDDTLTDILSNKYFEKYKKPEDLISQSLIKNLSMPEFSIISMILSLNESDDNFKLYDYLKDEEVTRHNLKKLLKIYQYMLYKPPPEPEEGDPNCCNITFRFVDDKLSFSRKFDKKTKIRELYHLINSKFPKLQYKLYKITPSTELNQIDNNLELENLFPSGIIQVLS